MTNLPTNAIERATDGIWERQFEHVNGRPPTIAEIQRELATRLTELRHRAKKNTADWRKIAGDLAKAGDHSRVCHAHLQSPCKCGRKDALIAYETAERNLA